MAHGHEVWKRLGDGKLAGEDFEEGLGHILPLAVLRNVLLALLFLTVVTVWISRIDFGHWNMVIAIAIASIKAVLVGTFFMHLKFENRTILMYVIYPVIILFILVGGSVADQVTKEHTLPFGVETLDKKIVIPHVGEEHGTPVGHHE